MRVPLRRADLTPARVDAGATSAGFACCLALPIALLHARALAEILIAAIDILFLAHVWATRDRAWLARPFARASLVWWAWLILCSGINEGGLLLAVLAVRLPLLALSLGTWLLAGEAGARRRHLVWLMIAACAAWIAIESWQQYLTGRNLFGNARYRDGALTGPFNKPRAGPGFILVFFPALVPGVMALLARPARAARLAGVAIAALGVLTMVLIGQRMPMVLMMFGLGLTAFLLPRLRVVVACAALAGMLLVAATPILSPATYHKLVLRFSTQMTHFPTSDYGLIYLRAGVLAAEHPLFGLGFDGFRRHCGDAAAQDLPLVGRPPAPAQGGIAGCNIHPHNYYLEAADNAGLPGLASFVAMVITALAALGRGQWRRPEGFRTGLFVGAVVALWPLASTSAFTSMPNAGWVFLVLGLGFAAAGQPSGGRGTNL
jgi:O-antigen ligase